MNSMERRIFYVIMLNDVWTHHTFSLSIYKKVGFFIVSSVSNCIKGRILYVPRKYWSKSGQKRKFWEVENWKCCIVLNSMWFIMLLL
jgi:hypothetical protein